MYFFIIFSYLSPTIDVIYFYPAYIFLRDSSLISITIESLEHVRLNFVTMFIFAYPNFVMIFCFVTWTTLFYSTFIIYSSSPSRLRHLIETYPEINKENTRKDQENWYLIIKFIITVGLVLFKELNVCIFEGLNRKRQTSWRLFSMKDNYELEHVDWDLMS